jgi:hypothetical protein
MTDQRPTDETVVRPGGTGLPPPPDPGEIAGLFPQLEVGEVLGHGSMGVVYRARQRNLDRAVALKILPAELGREAGFATLFRREALAMARLHHPRIVMVHDSGKAGDLFYLLMEFVDGPTLRAVLDEGPLPPDRALAVAAQMCDALGYAHEHGVVHRDVKPGNILFDADGHVRVADFGVARLFLADEPADVPGGDGPMGTLQYMAPEQAERPLESDHRADLYGVGVILHEMLTGILPVGDPEPVSARAEVDRKVDEIVRRALERDPARRYQDAGELRADLETSAAATGGTPGRLGTLVRRLVGTGDELTDAQRALRDRHFPNLEPRDFLLLLRAAREQGLEPGAVLAREGQDLPPVTLVLEGAAVVESGGRRLADIGPGTFIGEMSYVTGEPASATVTVTEAASCLVWSRSELRRLAQRHPQVGAALGAMMGADMSRKLRRLSRPD